ncbi:dehydroquinate synthase/iron-containing alcohol dehydrogenase family protein [Macellibacteroides fermentans]|uniref:Glycerol dehydrogenase-like iron-containing ADH family enzyme n=1 Tax=Macellibacteroides fermentans TaxID=879969 RepID=A0A8E1ZVS4_9PORP|nr:iron-containing alcohol dehydrogenase [Macellibacteroides fermentans]NYI48690.1 glycerol dehydrogenase-like iron-containing ADH family enzyme [Macellibacteroides fermentans]
MNANIEKALADALQVEAIDKRAWSVVQDGLPGALSDPEGIAAGSEQAIGKLIEGLMLGGFAMQATQSSRPASGAEHQFSHLWNMEHFLNHGEHVSHGFQVSIGTIALTAFYEQVLQTDLSELDVEKACRLWPDRDESDARALKLFEGTDFPLIGVQETGAKYIPADELREQLQLLKSNWAETRSRLRSQLLPLSELRRRLERVGAPVEPEQIGLSRSRLREAFIRAQYIRRRYTVLDLAVRTGYLDTWLDQLFGADGIWEIK